VEHERGPIDYRAHTSLLVLIRLAVKSGHAALCERAYSPFLDAPRRHVTPPFRTCRLLNSRGGSLVTGGASQRCIQTPPGPTEWRAAPRLKYRNCSPRLL
jgi:hypothetical protein